MGLTAAMKQDFDNAILNNQPIVIQALLAHPDIKKYVASEYSFINRFRNHNYTLAFAVRNGHKDILKILLTIPAVRQHVADDQNRMLQLAVNYGHTDIFNMLWAIPSVREDAAVDNNRAFLYAAKENRVDMIEALLEMPKVTEKAAERGNEALREAVIQGHGAIVKRLLKIPAVKEDIRQCRLAWMEAAHRGHTEVFVSLLTVPWFVEHITDTEHDLLYESASSGHWAIVLLLLQHYGENPIPYYIAAKAFEVPDNHPASEGIKEIIHDRIIAVTVPPPGESNVEALLHAWIKHWNLPPWPPRTELTSQAWCQYLFEQAAHCTEPRQAAIILLNLNGMSEEHQKALKQRIRAEHSSESAMESSMVAMVTKHYTEQVEPAFREKFNANGGVEGIEKIIKATILDKIIKYAAEPLKAQILAKRENILNGDPNDVAWARSIFSSKDDIYQTAWRAYDPEAPTVEWKNLLTAPSSTEAGLAVFSTAETGSNGETLQTSSDTIRKMAAHYYLVAIDERLSESERDIALEAFIAAIAEIRRAHNNTAVGEDNPSCFPGCFTRLHEVTKRNSHISNIKPGLMVALKEAYINEFEKAIAMAYLSCDSEDKVLGLYDALGMLSSVNARDVIAGNNNVFCNSRMNEDDNKDCRYNEALLKQRQDFIAQYMPLSALMMRLTKVLAKCDLTIDEHDAILVQSLVVDVCGGDAAFYLDAARERRTEMLNKPVEPTHGVLMLSRSQSLVGNTAIVNPRPPSPGPDSGKT